MTRPPGIIILSPMTSMKRMLRILLLAIPVVHASGCGGFYVLTVPDQVSSLKKEAVATLRLQRNDFLILTLPEERRPMRFSICRRDEASGELVRGGEKSAKTDDNGYAGVAFQLSLPPVSDKPGRYEISVDLQDIMGEELHAQVPLFVWDPARPVVAVDFDSIPRTGLSDMEEAVAALTSLAKRANIVYLTRTQDRLRADQREWLLRDGYPDGPILLWQRKSPCLVKSNLSNQRLSVGRYTQRESIPKTSKWDSSQGCTVPRILVLMLSPV